MADEVGIRFYNVSYLDDLLQAKVEDLDQDWESVKPALLPVAKRFFDNGMFIARILDINNYGYCQRAFMERKSGVDLILKLTANGDSLKVEPVEGHTLRILSMGATRAVFQQDAEAHRKSTELFFEAKLKFVFALTDKLYQERMAMVCADVVNRAAIHEVLKKEYDVDLKINFSGETNG